MKYCFVLFFIVFACAVSGEDRYIPHVPVNTSQFSTQLIVANTGYEARDGVVEAYDNSGLLLDSQSLSVPGKETLYLSTTDLFPGLQVGTLKMPEASNHQSLVFTIGYSEASSLSKSQSSSVVPSPGPWRFHPSANPKTVDGAVVVNAGAVAANITVKQFSASGVSLGESTFILESMSSWLVLFSSLFTPQPQAHYEVESSEPIVPYGLRTTNNGGLFWENPVKTADAYEPGLHVLSNVYSGNNLATNPLILTNRGDQPGSYTLLALDTNGVAVTVVGDTLNPFETRYLDPSTLSGETFSHLEMNLAQDVQIVAASNFVSTPEAVQHHWMQKAEYAPVWRFYPGNNGEQIDWFTLINSSEPDLTLILRQISSSGQVLGIENPGALLPSSGRFIQVNPFPNVEGSHIEVVGSHGFILSSTRHTTPIGDFLQAGRYFADLEFCNLSGAWDLWRSPVTMINLVEIVNLCPSQPPAP